MRAERTGSSGALAVGGRLVGGAKKRLSFGGGSDVVGSIISGIISSGSISSSSSDIKSSDIKSSAIKSNVECSADVDHNDTRSWREATAAV